MPSDCQLYGRLSSLACRMSPLMGLFLSGARFGSQHVEMSEHRSWIYFHGNEARTSILVHAWYAQDTNGPSDSATCLVLCHDRTGGCRTCFCFLVLLATIGTGFMWKKYRAVRVRCLMKAVKIF